MDVIGKGVSSLRNIKPTIFLNQFLRQYSALIIYCFHIFSIEKIETRGNDLKFDLWYSRITILKHFFIKHFIVSSISKFFFSGIENLRVQ